MTTSFKWTIPVKQTTPQVADKVNVVYNVYWRCDASQTNDDGVIYATCLEGSTPIPYIESDPFIPYEQLTTEQILEWIIDTKTSVENQLQAKLEVDMNAPEIVVNP